MQDVTLPKMGQGMEAGDVLEWHVDEGDSVETGEPVVTIESDKTTAEITAEQDGYLLSKHVDAGETVPVGKLLGQIGEQGEDEDDEPTDADREVSPGTSNTAEGTSTDSDLIRATPSARRRARMLEVDLETVAATRGATRITVDDVAAVAEEVTEAERAAPSSEQAGESHHFEEILGSPWARTVSDEYDVTIEDVGRAEGTDRVRGHHVKSYVESKPDERRPSEPTSGGRLDEPIEKDRGESEQQHTDEPITGAKKRMFQQMDTAANEYANTTTVARVDVTELWELYGRLSRVWDPDDGDRLSVTAFVVKAAAETITSYPPLNAEVVADDTLRVHHNVNVGIAINTDAGLFVPTVEDANRATTRELSRAIHRLAAEARDDSLTYDDMQGGTFTVSNAGSIGAYINTPQINPPQTAILGICKIVEEPGVVDGDVVPRRFMHLTLTYDHRVVEGATAVEFLQAVKAKLETPESLLS